MRTREQIIELAEDVMSGHLRQYRTFESRHAVVTQMTLEVLLDIRDVLKSFDTSAIMTAVPGALPAPETVETPEAVKSNEPRRYRLIQFDNPPDTGTKQGIVFETMLKFGDWATVVAIAGRAELDKASVRNALNQLIIKGFVEKGQ